MEGVGGGGAVVQAGSAAFAELIEATGGGVLCQAGDRKALASSIEELLLHPERARSLGEAARRAVFERFSDEVMAAGMLNVFQQVAGEVACEASLNKSR